MPQNYQYHDTLSSRDARRNDDDASSDELDNQHSEFSTSVAVDIKFQEYKRCEKPMFISTVSLPIHTFFTFFSPRAWTN
jgi:hypothetical protein